MTTATTTAGLEPAPGEDARSMLVAGTTLELTTDDHGRFLAMGGHAVEVTGGLLLSVPSSCRLAQHLHRTSDVPARVEVVDTAPVAVRDRVRGRLVLAGWIEAVPAASAAATWASAGQTSALPADGTLLRLEPAEVLLERSGTPTVLEPEEWAAATADPLAAHEADVLQHLAAGHPEELAALVALLPDGVRRAARRVVPLRLHRRAVVLRVESDTGHDDVAIALPRSGELPVTAEQVLHALRRLLGGCCGGPAR